jgi:hypothetical protein
VRAVNVEVPTVGHCYPYYLVSVVIDGEDFNYYTGGTTHICMF